MVTYLGYARTGKEFEVAAGIENLGLNVWCGKRMEFLRRSKKRRFDPVVTPYLPNYIFAEIPAERFLEVLAVKYLASTLTPLSAPDMRSLSRFQDAVAKEYAEAERIKGNQELVCQFKAGDAIRAIDGPFADTILAFVKLVHHDRDPYPKIRAHMELFGRRTPIELDPLSVRAAK